MAIMAFHTPNAGISFGPALPLCGGDLGQGPLPVLPNLADANKGHNHKHFFTKDSILVSFVSSFCLAIENENV